MSEYQRYEFMTIDRPLTRAQLDAVNNLSSHIEATSTHAIIEYHWGDFKHDPIKVLHQFFDGFLYYANWGNPQLALRFPHGILPANLVKEHDYDEFVTFIQHPDYDILNINFGGLDGYEYGIEMDYQLESLIGIRDELMQGDLRALYIVWLASQDAIANDDVDTSDIDDEEEVETDAEEDETIGSPPVPDDFGTLTNAQRELANLLQIPETLLKAASLHSQAAEPAPQDNFVAWVELLPHDRRSDYLVQLAYNVPGLQRQLVKELRELDKDKTRAEETAPTAEHVAYATLLAESQKLQVQMEHAQKEQQRQAHLQKLKNIRDNQETYWRQVAQAAARGTGTGYDEALRILLELREASEQFQEGHIFQTRFHTWVQSHLHRPALIKRLQAHQFVIESM